MYPKEVRGAFVFAASEVLFVDTTPNNGSFVRGYMLLYVLDFIRKTPETRGVIDQVPAHIKEVAEGLKHADWCKAEDFSETIRLIARAANSDEALARDLLIRAGVFISEGATNTFLKLLMKMLTPALFAKKMPEFWKRDSTMGRLEVEVAPPKIIVRMMDMEGFDHGACTTAGFVKQAFEGMGKTILDIQLPDWSLSTPYVNGSTIELTWA